VTWRSHGAPFNGTSAVGVDYLIQKYSRGSRWDLAPNGLSQSNIGIKGKEPLAAGWTFIFDLQAGFDPYSLHFANEPHSVAQNAGIPLTSQDSNADSSRAGQFYNSVGYLGVSSPYGTLTVFRQNSLTLDAVFAYDPMGASYAFADRLAGNYLRRRRYRRLPIQHVSEVSRRHWPVQGCGAVAIRRLRSEPRRDRFLPVPTRWRHSHFGRRHAFARRYRQLRPERRVDRYEFIRYAPPSNPFAAGTGFSDISGDFVCAGRAAINNTNINNTAFNAGDKLFHVFWTGVKYAVTDNLDVIGAYYHYDQPHFGAPVNCANAAAFPNCHGTFDAVSFVADWQFAKRFDAYAGLMFSQVNGGLANGFLHRNTIDPTVGLRFRF
jgi:predicted porin